MKITLAQLCQANACSSQVLLFEQTFGAEVEVTLELCEKYAHTFDFPWAARFLLNPQEFERQRAHLLAEYERQRAHLLAEYVRQRAPLYAEYDRQRAPLLAEYEMQVARLFFSLS